MDGAAMGSNHPMSPALSPDALMSMAHEAALEGLFRTSPNPRVGCVLTNSGGEVIGRGSTQMAGQAHAEVMALRDASNRGNSVAGGTAYVTLEPCSHHGRTGPCCEALIEAGIRRVVASVADPNPLVQGRGFARLRAAAVEVEVGLGGQDARELNIGFFTRMERGTPWVRMKAAASLDGRTALPDGQSQWITSESARADTHYWRARSCAILTGVGTVLADNPRLDVRLTETPRQPWLVVLDSKLRISADAHVFHPARKVLIFSAVRNPAREAEITAAGGEVIFTPGASGRVDLKAVMEYLGAQGINELHVEAGSVLNGALLSGGYVDEVLLYMAPKILGDGRSIAKIPPLATLGQAPRLKIQQLSVIGDDVRIIARRFY